MTGASEYNPKILHCVEQLHRNAIENWLVRMWLFSKNRNVEVDWWFHVQISDPGDLEAKHPELKKRIIRSKFRMGQWLRFFFHFTR